MLFNIFLHPSRSPASSCHSGTSSALSHGFTRRASLRSTASSATTAAAPNVNSSVSLSLSPLARQSPAGLWCGGARPDPLYCVGSSRCPDKAPTDRGLKKRTGSSCARCKVNWLSVRDVHETMTRWQGDIGTGQHHLADP
jgi:hypothetical protein